MENYLVCVNWIWSVTKENWPIVKKEKKWAAIVKNKKNAMKIGDKAIFYIKGTNCFQGIYEVTSDWSESNKTTFGNWNTTSNISEDIFELNLKPIQLGYANIRKLISKLNFIENKKYHGIYLKGSRGGPANFTRSISDHDYQLIHDELQLMKEKSYHEETSELFDTEELVLPENWDFITKRIHDMNTPNLKSIKNIVEDIDSGRYAIPMFQRSFTWKRKEIEDLWESIFQGFFIGSILTWKSKEQFKKIPIHGAKNFNPDHEIILDGQQRITSLYYSIVHPDTPLPDHRSMLFFVNLKVLLDPNGKSSEIVDSEVYDKAKKKGLLNKERQFAEKKFPMTAFYNRDYPIWLNEFKEYLKSIEKYDPDYYDTVYKKIMEILDNVWNDYKIPVIQLSESIFLDDVAEIFEKINSKGIGLSVFDLLNAKFHLFGISLRDKWNQTKTEYSNIEKLHKNIPGFEKYIIQGMCLYKKRYIRRKELFNLSDAYMINDKFEKEEFLNDWKKISQCVSKAIEKLTSQLEYGFGAVTSNIIPYSIMIPVLAALLCEIKDKKNEPKCMEQIEKWYWSTVISDAYSSSTDSKIEKDYKEMLEWFDDDKEYPDIIMKQREQIMNYDFSSIRSGTSSYKAIMCLISKNDARDFLTDKPISYNKLDDHHIFPKSKEKDFNCKISINSILNRTLIDRKTNREYIKDYKPHEYIMKILTDQTITESNLQKRLQPHFISKKAFNHLLHDEFNEFTNERQIDIKNRLRDLIM